MGDLTGLKKRVELIDLRLKTAHSARERESAALVDIWEQIRVRLLDQNAEITRLRDRVSELEDNRDELLQMIHGLLSAVEGGLERMSDETVPQIKDMAGDLLKDSGETLSASGFAGGKALTPINEQDIPSSSRPPVDEKKIHANFHSDLLNAVERSLDTVPEEISKPDSDNRRRRIGEPASPGIRDLIARIEGAVGVDLMEKSSSSVDEDEEDDELTRDLREIEALRGELHGLRERISGGSR
jgi:hypothetical protein